MDRRLSAILAADVVGFAGLMEADEEGTLSRIKTLREEVIAPAVAEGRGRIVKLMGDGLLGEFPSVVEAVRCAINVQWDLAAHAAAVDGRSPVRFRLGVHLGDVIVDGDDIYGDGVNIAARLEGAAEPGGICISRQVFDQVEGRLDANFKDLGSQRLKNLERPVHVYAVAHRSQEAAANPTSQVARNLHQEIRFCRSTDGVRLAYATVGEGPPLVKTANWLNHLEYDWETPVWRHFLRMLAAENTLIRYDQRGTGLSDWNAEDLSIEKFLADLEAVVDAAGLDRFTLVGVSQGCAISAAYAVRYPERVRRMVFYGGFARGGMVDEPPEHVTQREAVVTLMEQGWGRENPALRQMFTTQFIPDGSPEQIRWFNELQRRTTSAENAVRIRRANEVLDVRNILSEVRVPTLVLHCRDDEVVSLSRGREMAAAIPGARFVPLEGRNHLMLEHEPAFARFREEVRAFLAEDD